MIPLRKYPSPMNFAFVDDFALRAQGAELALRSRRGSVRFRLLAGGAVQVQARLASAAQPRPALVELDATPAADALLRVAGRRALLQAGALSLEVAAGSGAFVLRLGRRLLLHSAARPFGRCGEKSLALLRSGRGAVVYGLGEKAGRLDRAGRAYRLWNVDVIGDLPYEHARDDFDPMYVSVPLYITRDRGGYFGVLLDNPGATFAHAGVEQRQLPAAPRGAAPLRGDEHFALGCEEGALDLFLLPGPSLGDVVRRFARLAGVHELPPVWALGYQQCRWSYMSARELQQVSDRLAAARIATGALWMDIDYMDGFRIFTFAERGFSAGARRRCRARLQRRGTELVTIIDPGIKAEPGYAVYEEARRQELLCATPEGQPFRGLVWPGQTVMPDYALPECRAWWAGRIARHLRESGAAGIWCDMNDPSIGAVPHDDMRFDHGRLPHSAVHNAYGHLMARATWDGFARHDPEQRPFILTRSGCTGTQRYAAVWTGDNSSSALHMRLSIPMCVNLALSGISLVGADVGGFDGDADEALLVAWSQLGALLPFFRNHSAKGTRPQEPYAYSRRAAQTIRRAVDTRLKLLPYLYAELERHQREGDALLRPLSYEFAGRRYERVNDEYLLGPQLLCAPFVELEQPQREVLLPPGWWYSLHSGRWLRGGRQIRVQRSDALVAFVRDGAILPCLEGASFFPQPDLRRLSLHVFCRARPGRGLLYEDDGRTRAYQRGEHNRYALRTVGRGAALRLEVAAEHLGYADGCRRLSCYWYGVAPTDAVRATTAWPCGGHAVRRTRLALR